MAPASCWGMGAGGEAIHMEQFFTTCPWTMPESHAYGVFVNVAGQRFINEDCYHGRVSRAAVDQAGGKVYLLLDNAHFVQLMDFAFMSHCGNGRQLGRSRARAGNARRHAFGDDGFL